MTGQIYFSKFLVTEQVFYVSKHTFALVNLKPIVPGHILIVPLRTSAITLGSLTPEESQDYFRTLQLIQQFIKWEYKADSLNIAMQDGPEAGQSVPHVHTHVIPRYRKNNFGDEIYKKIDDWQFRRDIYLGNGGREGRKQDASNFAPDRERFERDATVMHEEARTLKKRLGEFVKEFPEINEKWGEHN
ncbi:similar to Saccharomyces cerevisiae YDR305C HNT2 Dinucleoside triphosphate hydrolase [Maudiozyma saulgeensis]|uniref:Bis(5'-adenosyl)-triphosphatase n=1 Tax=Maudiozyma saulgeensis TaxID=1789683 RepID=A0A1X7R5D4_9SACH|nr:similar to Saccharomyces cerevisiae YDR305C HNT2 Dinucleoside triphosphate hydrolase [Kazachstania saulgeensis]